MTKFKKGNMSSEDTQFSTSDVTEMPTLFSDTTHTNDSETSSWEDMYNLLENKVSRIIETKETADATTSSEASYFEAACSFLHRIIATLKILPYTDMVKWIIDNISILDHTFQTSRKEVIGSFTTKDLKIMYHIPHPQKVYDKAFEESKNCFTLTPLLPIFPPFSYYYHPNKCNKYKVLLR